MPRTGGGDRTVPAGNGGQATVADLGLTRKAIHEARQLRDTEAAAPGVIRRTINTVPERGNAVEDASAKHPVLCVPSQYGHLTMQGHYDGAAKLR